MGLLDLTPEQNAQLLGLAGGLLSNSGPSLQPRGFGQALGGGIQGMQQAQQQGIQQKLMGLQGQHIGLANQLSQQQIDQGNDWRKMFGLPSPGQASSVPAQPGPAQVAPDMSGLYDPTLKDRLPPVPANMPGETMGQAPQGPAAPGKSPLGGVPPEMRPLIASMGPQAGAAFLAQLQAKQMERGQFVPETLNGMPGQRDRFSGKFEPFPAGTLPDQWEQITGPSNVPMQRNKRTGEVKPIDPTLTKVNVGLTLPPQEQEFAKTVGGKEGFGGIYTNLVNGEMRSPTNIAKYERLGDLLDQVNTGKFAGTTMELKRIAKGAGMDLEALGIRDDLGPAQAAQAMSRQMALELRNPANGAGMPGAMSDADRNYLESMVPGIETDPAGRKMIIDAAIKLEKRNQDVAKLARDYRRKNGTFDEGFFDTLSQWSAAHPLFDKPPPVKAPAASPAAAPVADPLGLFKK